MRISLHRHVNRTLNQTSGNKDVVHRNNEKRNDVQNKEGGHGMDFGVQVSSVRVRSTCFKSLIGFWDVEGV